MTRPSRHLLGSKPHRCVSALDTDIRRAFRRWRLLARLRGCRDPLAAHQGDVRGVEVPKAHSRIFIPVPSSGFNRGRAAREV